MSKKLSNFYVRSAIFTALSAVAAVLNYALYPVMGRVLQTNDFGNFTALSALSNQVLGILLAFNVTSIYLVKTFPEKEARQYAEGLQRTLIWLFLIASLLLLVASPLIGDRLKIWEPISFLVVTGILLAAVPGVIWTGYLQGHKELIKVGLYSFSASIAKLLFAFSLGAFAGVTGGLLGILLGTITGLLLLKIFSGRQLPSLTSLFKRLSHTQKSFLINSKLYILTSLLVVGSLSFLQNIDITFAKYLFNPDVAGVYAGISIISNALYYGFFLFIWILLPEIDPRKMMHNRRLLMTAYRLIGILGLAAIAIIYILHKQIIGTLLGSVFYPYEGLLLYAALYQIGLISLTLYAYYLLVLRSRRAIILAISILVPCLVLPFFTADNPRSLIKTLDLGLVVGFGFYYVSALLLQVRNHD